MTSAIKILPNYDSELSDKFQAKFMWFNLTKNKATVNNYKVTFRKWLDYCYERNIFYLEMSPENISNFIRGLDVNPNTKNTELGRMKRLLHLLYSVGSDNPKIVEWHEDMEFLLTTNAVLGGEYDNHKVERPYITMAQVDDYLENGLSDKSNFVHLRDRVLISLLFSNALRKGEVMSLEWWQISETTIKPKNVKAKDPERTYEPVPIWKTKQYLEDYKKAVIELVGYLPEKVIVTLASSRKEIRDVRTETHGTFIYKVMKRMNEYLGVDVMPRSGRISVATHHYKKIRSSERTSKLLRHSSPVLTEKYYIQDLLKEEIANEIGNELES